MIRDIPVKCECGSILNVEEGMLEEVAAGVYGTIPCPKCGKRMNPEIIKAYEEENKKS